MDEQLEGIRQQLNRLIKNIENPEWAKAEIVIEFPPYLNKGFKTRPSFLDIENKRLRIFLNFDEEFNNLFYKTVFLSNQENKYNQIVFVTNRNEYENGVIDISFNQAIEDDFQNNMPKSKRGKTLPWWKNENEIKDL